MELTDKERKLLEDELKAEYLSMNKYKLYASQASDPEIKDIFNLVNNQEESHANTIKTLLIQGGFQPQNQQ